MLHNAKVAQIHEHGFFANEQKKIREGEQLVEGHMAETIGGKYDYRVLHVQKELLGHFLMGVQEWEQASKMKLRQLLSCREAEYQESKASLLAKMKEEMQLYLVTWKLGGCKIKSHPVKPKEEKPPDWMREMQRELGGPGECTVYPKGAGSRVYRQFKADQEARAYQKMGQADRDFVQKFKAGGGHVIHA